MRSSRPWPPRAGSWAGRREERVAGVLVGVELVGLAVGLQGLLQLGDLLGRRVLVLGAEQPEQRARQVLWSCARSGRPERWPFGGRADHERAVAVHGGVERQAARGQERLAAARAVADRGRPCRSSSAASAQIARPRPPRRRPDARRARRRRARRGRGIVGSRAGRLAASRGWGRCASSRRPRTAG